MNLYFVINNLSNLCVFVFFCNKYIPGISVNKI